MREKESADGRLTAGAVESGRMSDELRASRLFEPLFRGWVFEQLMPGVGVELTFNEAMFGGAEHVGCSPQTAYLYLHKMLSNPGAVDFASWAKGKAEAEFERRGSLGHDEGHRSQLVPVLQRYDHANKNRRLHSM